MYLLDRPLRRDLLLCGNPDPLTCLWGRGGGAGSKERVVSLWGHLGSNCCSAARFSVPPPEGGGGSGAWAWYVP